MSDERKISPTQIAETMAADPSGFSQTTRWRAGTIAMAAGGRQTDLNADEIAESIIIDAAVRTGCSQKMLQTLAERVAQTMGAYLKSPQFEKRLRARVEQAVELILDSVDIESAREKVVETFNAAGEPGERRTIRELVEEMYRLRVASEFEQRVTSAAREDLQLALSEVRVKFSAAGGK